MTGHLYFLATVVVIATTIQAGIIYWAFRKYGNITGTSLLMFSAVFTAITWLLFVVSSFEVTDIRMKMLVVGLYMKLVAVLTGCIGYYLWGKAFREI